MKVSMKDILRELRRRGDVKFANNDAAKREFSRICRRLSNDFDDISSTMKEFKDVLRDASEYVFSDNLPRNNRDQAAGAIQKMKQMVDFLEKNCARVSDYFDKGDRF